MRGPALVQVANLSPMLGRALRAGMVGIILSAVAGSALAKVSKEEADRLRKDLTPTGGERAGNADGTIPAWTGGLTTAPPCYKGRGERYCDPFKDDRPMFTITAANVGQYRNKLSAGQISMFAKYPQSYKMHIYQTRRTVAYPDWVYEATYRNALNAELVGNGESLRNAVIGVPLPFPKAGQDPIWNHKLRWRGAGATRWNVQAAVTADGSFVPVKIREDVLFPYSQQGARPENLRNVAIYFLQNVTTPPRLAGVITLVHETIDQVSEPRRAWQYNPGQRRLRRAPNVGYDNPGTGADGLRTNDQLDMFNGALDRYTWKLVGKREMYVPYNSYKIHSDEYKYTDIFLKSHINQDLARYELHRVWVVEAVTRPGKNHAYKKRVFYLDEDSWQILLVDCYDNRNQLWRWQEAHNAIAYDFPLQIAVGETVYDLYSNRYLAMAFNNEEPETFEAFYDRSHFEPANVQKMATR